MGFNDQFTPQPENGCPIPPHHLNLLYQGFLVHQKSREDAANDDQKFVLKVEGTNRHWTVQIRYLSDNPTKDVNDVLDFYHDANLWLVYEAVVDEYQKFAPTASDKEIMDGVVGLILVNAEE